MKKFITYATLLCFTVGLNHAAYAESKTRYADPRSWRESTKNPGTKEMLDQLLTIYDKLSKVSKTKAKLYISDSPGLNAFATQTKSSEAVIVLNMGAIEALSKDQDAMAALLAHELGHVAKSHVTDSQTTADALSFLGAIAGAVINYKLGTRGVNLGSTAGDMTGFAASVVGRKFDRDQEREADALALQWITAAGYSPMGSVRLQKALHDGDDKSATSLLSTHPGGDERIVAAEKFVAETPAAQALKDKPLIAFASPSSSSSGSGDSGERQVARRSTENVDFLLNPDESCDWFGESGMKAMVPWRKFTAADNRGYVCQYVSAEADEEGVLTYGRVSIDAIKNEIYVSLSAQAYRHKRKEANEIVTKGDLENFATRDETRYTLMQLTSEWLEAQGKGMPARLTEMLSSDKSQSISAGGVLIEYGDDEKWKSQRMLSISMTLPVWSPRHKALIAALDQPNTVQPSATAAAAAAAVAGSAKGDAKAATTKP
jgi:Zn-dependent protease with chaperone function